jgi:hypothetical protein
VPRGSSEPEGFVSLCKPTEKVAFAAFAKTKEPLKGENKRKEGELMPTKRARKTSKHTIIEPHKGHRRYVRRSKTD